MPECRDAEFSFPSEGKQTRSYICGDVLQAIRRAVMRVGSDQQPRNVLFTLRILKSFVISSWCRTLVDLARLLRGDNRLRGEHFEILWRKTSWTGFVRSGPPQLYRERMAKKKRPGISHSHTHISLSSSCPSDCRWDDLLLRSAGL